MFKKLYIENLGCVKNQVDAEVIAYNLSKDGFELVEDAQKADLIIINTCGFIDSAKEESINTFFSLKESCPKARIIVSGCLAQRYSQELKEQLVEADAIFGNRNLLKVNEIVKEVFEDKSRQTKLLRPEYPSPYEESDTRDKLFNFPGSAYLKISEGCNHRCGYCAIPLIRGDLRSRPKEAVLEEATRLVSNGIKEINIIAQDLAAYGTDWDKKSHFCELLEDICKIEGDFKVRMLYIHPDSFPMELLNLMQRQPKILHYFDLPFQHASSHILTPMKRTGNPQVYSRLIDSIKQAIPDAVIRTTIMLGFPGETDDDFNQVYDFTKYCRFNWMGSFTFSLEEGTYAATLTTEEEHLALHKIAVKRQKKLQRLQEKISSQRLEEFVGKTYHVLIEELVEGEDLAIGRIYAQAPEVDGLTVVMGRDMIPGNVYECGITKVNGIDLEAIKIN